MRCNSRRQSGTYRVDSNIPDSTPVAGRCEAGDPPRDAAAGTDRASVTQGRPPHETQLPQRAREEDCSNLPGRNAQPPARSSAPLRRSNGRRFAARRHRRLLSRRVLGSLLDHAPVSHQRSIEARPKEPLTAGPLTFITVCVGRAGIAPSWPSRSRPCRGGRR